MQLVEAGRIELDAPVQTYLPEFSVADPSGARTITVRMLLQQTSGLADAGFPEMTLSQPATIAERVNGLREAELVSEPGTTFHYFNPNYAILARVVEVVSGRSFADYLHARVFTPIGDERDDERGDRGGGATCRTASRSGAHRGFRVAHRAH